MKRNQFYDLNNCITKIERAAKRKSAYIQIAIPDEVCESFITAIINRQQGKECNIKGLSMSWLDTSIKES